MATQKTEQAPKRDYTLKLIDLLPFSKERKQRWEASHRALWNPHGKGKAAVTGLVLGILYNLTVVGLAVWPMMTFAVLTVGTILMAAPAMIDGVKALGLAGLTKGIPALGIGALIGLAAYMTPLALSLPMMIAASGGIPLLFAAFTFGSAWYEGYKEELSSLQAKKNTDQTNDTRDELDEVPVSNLKAFEASEDAELSPEQRRRSRAASVEMQAPPVVEVMKVPAQEGDASPKPSPREVIEDDNTVISGKEFANLFK